MMNRSTGALLICLLFAGLGLTACDPGEPAAPPTAPPEPQVEPANPDDSDVPVPTPQSEKQSDQVEVADNSDAADPVAEAADASQSASDPAADQAAKWQAASTGTAPAEARSSEFLPVGEREAYDLDYQVTGADGQLMKLADLVGHPMAMTFFYTRCPMADMCPMVVASMRQLHRLTREAGIDEQVRLVMLTMDPYHDTPARLESYADEHGLAGNNLVLLRPDPEKLRQLFQEFGFIAQFNEDFTIDHPLDLYLIDAQGRFVRYYTGSLWDNSKVVEDLQKLVAETEPNAE